MRIGIDCRLAGAKHAGIGRYTQHLVIELVAANPRDKWVLFFFDQQQADSVLTDLSVAQRVSCEIILAPIQHYTLAEQIQLLGVFQRAELDLLHVPHFNVPLLYRGPFVVTIHDLLWHSQRGGRVTTLSGWKYWLKYAGYRFVTRRAVNGAQVVFVPTLTVKNQLFKYFPRLKTEVIVTSEGIGSAFGNAKVLSSAKIKKAHASRQLVYVGSLYSHKNVNLVLSWLQDNPDFRLVLAGARNVFADTVGRKIKKLGISKQVEFKGYLPDGELIELLQQSFALVQPSKSEGFGLTGVEAMAVGCPVLASDLPIFKEVYDDHAFFFDADSKASFGEAVTELAAMGERDRNLHITKALNWTKRYSWAKMATTTYHAYPRN